MNNPNDSEVLNSIFNPLLPNGGLLFEDNIPEELKEDEYITDDAINSKQSELEGIKAAEVENFDAALALFSKAIELAPNRASNYNNRAQTYRLMGRISEAKEDLSNAINLSGGKGRAGCQAYCQRGLINLKENRTDEAKHDFEYASKLGSRFAKAQLVQMNPYAALCNKMLRGVFVKLQRGEPINVDQEDDNTKT